MLLCPVVACKCVVVVDVVVVAVVVVVQCKSIASQYLRRPTTRSHSIALAAASTSFGPRFDFGWLWVFVLGFVCFGFGFWLAILLTIFVGYHPEISLQLHPKSEKKWKNKNK